MVFTRNPRSLVGFLVDLLVIPRSGVVENTHFLITFGYHFWWVISDRAWSVVVCVTTSPSCWGQGPYKVVFVVITHQS